MASNEELKRTLAALQGSKSAAPRLSAATLASIGTGAKTKRPEKAKSLFGQAGQFLHDALPGIGHFAKDVGKTLASPILAAGDAADAARRDLFNNESVDWNPLNDQGGVLGGLEASQRKYQPAIAQQTDSFIRTGKRLPHLPSEYAAASKRGDILATVLEDLSNVSMVGSAVGKGLTGAGARAMQVGEATGDAGILATGTRLAELGPKVQHFAEFGGKIADAPFVAPLKGAKAVLNKSGIGEAATGMAGKAWESAVLKHPELLNRFTEKGRAIVSDATKNLEVQPMTEHARVARAFQRVKESAPGMRDNPLSAVEENAAITLFTGEADRLKAVLDRNPELRNDPVAFDKTVNDLFALKGEKLAEHHVTPEGARMALEALNDPASPVHARLAPVMTELDRQYQKLADLSRDPQARAHPLTREDWTDLDATTLTQLRKDPSMAYALDKVKREWEDAQAQAAATKSRHPKPRTTELDRPPVVPMSELRSKLDQYQNEWANKVATPDELAKTGGVLPKLDEMVDLNDPASWNPEWRVAATDLARARQAKLAEIEGLPEGPAKEAATVQLANIESLATPEALSANSRATYARGQGLTDRGTALNPAGLNPSSRAGTTISGAEKYRSGVTPTPHFVEGQARLIADQAELLSRNKGFHKLVETHGITPETILGTDLMDAIRAEAKAQADEYGLRGADYKSELSKGISEAMSAKGMEAWPTPKRGSVEGFAVNLKSTPVGFVDETTLFFPKGLRKIVADRMELTQPPYVLRQLEKTNAWFKRLTLPLSVTWHIGDAISNALFATTSGELTPLQFVDGMKLTKKLMQSDGGYALLDHLSSASDAGSLSWMDHKDWLQRRVREVEEAEKRAKMGKVRGALSDAASPLRKAQNAGFAFNRKLNEIERNGYKIAKLDEMLKAEGMSVEGLAMADPRILESPHIQKAIAEVVDTANEVFGTKPLTPMERNWIKPIMPFYHWVKIINSFAVKLGANQPARALWMMHLGNMAQTDTELPGFLNGAFDTPFGYLSLNSLNPFADIGGATSRSGLLRSLAPGVKVAAAAGLGLDLNKNANPLTHSNDLSSMPDEAGRFAPEALWKHPGALLGYTLGQTPVTRAWRDIMPNVSLPTGLDLGAGARHGSSEVITRPGQGRLGSKRQWVTAIPALAGVRFPFPNTTEEEVKQINAANAKRRKRALAQIGRKG